MSEWNATIMVTVVGSGRKVGGWQSGLRPPQPVADSQGPWLLQAARAASGIDMAGSSQYDDGLTPGQVVATTQ
ncbi:hypothetical protein J6590_046889 [Homalodisca vitripennis]|nr:hypothetical protein J6590_046889 [Homalodisca vitripennis]